MNEQLQQFFAELAQKFSNENDLSDFTYVALEVIPDFKKDFVRFFRPSLEIGEDEIQVFREFKLESNNEQPPGRPDFLLQCGSWDLIVENKILDTNYHFDQYGVKPLIPGRAKPYVCLIANHKVEPGPQSKDWTIKTWEEFIEHFEKKNYSAFNDVFSAYMGYVKKVCAMNEFECFHFDINSLSALTNFTRMVDRVLKTISSGTLEVEVEDPEYRWNFGESWAGRVFYLKRRASDIRLHLFFGITFSAPTPTVPTPAVLVGLNRNGNLKYFDRIAKSFKKNYDPEGGGGGQGSIDLTMPHDQFNALNNETEKQKQIEILKRFLENKCEELLNSIESKARSSR